MSALFDSFETRVRRVYRLLRSRHTAFVLVACPEEQVLRQAEYFCGKVSELRMSLRAVVYNRVHQDYEGPSRGIDRQQLHELVRRTDGQTATEALVENFLRFEAEARGDMVRMESFRRQLPKGVVVVQVPNFDVDLHDIEGLTRMHPYLFKRVA